MLGSITVLQQCVVCAGEREGEGRREGEKGKGSGGGQGSRISQGCSVGELGSIPGLRRSPGGGHGNPLQYSCLENPHGQSSLAG